MRLLIPILGLIFSMNVRADNAALDAWLKNQSSITSLDSTFTQERKLPSLKQPVSTPGRLSFSKPDKFRWQLGEPVATLAVSDGKTITLIEEADKSARQVSANSPQAARFSMLSGKAFESPETFHAAFEIIESRVSSGIHQYTLKPKDRRTRSNVPWVFLDIDPEKKELRALEIELQDQSRLRTIFHNPKVNLKLPESLFAPDLTGYTVK
jgi:outer membrane lipoprotein carrier protein